MALKAAAPVGRRRAMLVALFLSLIFCPGAGWGGNAAPITNATIAVHSPRTAVAPTP